MQTRWSEAVQLAVRRLVGRSGGLKFTRQALIEQELGRIINETGSRGATPEMTLSRELQQLRDSGKVEFVAAGQYRLMEQPVSLPSAEPSKCVFIIGSHSIYEDEPDRFYRFPQRWLKAAARSVGEWILYQEPRRAGQRGYYAAAKVEQIIRDPASSEMYLALIEPGSFLEFGHDVPFRVDGEVMERGLLTDGRINNGRAIQSIRPIVDEDFNRIIAAGLVEEDDILPRADETQSGIPSSFHEEPEPYVAAVDRSTVLVERKIRDRQFRRRILDAYDCRCALTGMQWINGGGRAEVQAAHIMSVEAGGPDTSANGIALSGTAHWMFDRGLISLSDQGAILLSQKINDMDGVERLIHNDRQARLPNNPAERPHPRYLAWHREYHQIAERV
ncbi:HNH endonuclease [Pacificimonas sp. ICDLI1SI03]